MVINSHPLYQLSYSGREPKSRSGAIRGQREGGRRPILQKTKRRILQKTRRRILQKTRRREDEKTRRREDGYFRRREDGYDRRREDEKTRRREDENSWPRALARASTGLSRGSARALRLASAPVRRRLTWGAGIGRCAMLPPAQCLRGGPWRPRVHRQCRRRGPCR